MNLRYARTFVTVAELGTVSKAAIACGLPSLLCLDRSAPSSRNSV